MSNTDRPSPPASPTWQEPRWNEITRDTPAAEDGCATLPIGAMRAQRSVMPFVSPPAAAEGAHARTPAPPSLMSPPPRSAAPSPPPTGAAPPPRLDGVLAMSNAAAGASTKPEPATGGAQLAPAPKQEPTREIVELLWYDPAALPRIRRNLAWKKIIAELKPRPSDDDFDGGLPPEQMKAAKDRRDVLGVLARGEVMDMAGIRRAMEMAVLEDGSFVPPYVLTAGTLELLFDEMETLKATLVAVAPFVPLDRKLKETVDYVNEVMKTPGIERARTVVEGLTARVKAAFGQQGRGVPAEYLEEVVEGMLVEGRCYQQHAPKGEQHIGAAFTPTGTNRAVPVFIQTSLKKGATLPRGCAVRVVAEAHTRTDASSTRPLWLQIVALAMTTGD